VAGREAQQVLSIASSCMRGPQSSLTVMLLLLLVPKELLCLPGLVLHHQCRSRNMHRADGANKPFCSQVSEKLPDLQLPPNFLGKLKKKNQQTPSMPNAYIYRIYCYQRHPTGITRAHLLCIDCELMSMKWKRNSPPRFTVNSRVVVVDSVLHHRTT
jgi:hypothetical protein